MNATFLFSAKLIRSDRRSVAGFSLIELMIAVAIVAILAAVVLPSYSQYIARGARADARTQLMALAQFLERNYTSAGCYNQTQPGGGNSLTRAVGAAPNGALPVSQSPDSGRAKYNLYVASTGQDYDLSAVPTGTMTGDACGTLTLDEAGVKGATGALGPTECWQH